VGIGHQAEQQHVQYQQGELHCDAPKFHTLSYRFTKGGWIVA
jgi:hypothetical protein